MLGKRGYTILRGIVCEEQLVRLRKAADIVALESGSACVRKVCHRSTEIKAFAGNSLLMDLLPDGYDLVRSILFDKTPGSNWPVLWHQDLTIAVEEKFEVSGYGPWSTKDGVPHVQPPLNLLDQMITMRVHLDDAGKENGGLRVVPGSHLSGVIPSDEVGSCVDSNQQDCDCRAGDVLVMSPLLVHSSQRSRNPGHRRILHFEYAPVSELHSRLKWYEIDSVFSI